MQTPAVPRTPEPQPQPPKPPGYTGVVSDPDVPKSFGPDAPLTPPTEPEKGHDIPAQTHPAPPDQHGAAPG